MANLIIELKKKNLNYGKVCMIQAWELVYHLAKRWGIMELINSCFGWQAGLESVIAVFLYTLILPCLIFFTL